MNRRTKGSSIFSKPFGGWQNRQQPHRHHFQTGTHQRNPTTLITSENTQYERRCITEVSKGENYANTTNDAIINKSRILYSSITDKSSGIEYLSLIAGVASKEIEGVFGSPLPLLVTSDEYHNEILKRTERDIGNIRGAFEKTYIPHFPSDLRPQAPAASRGGMFEGEITKAWQGAYKRQQWCPKDTLERPTLSTNAQGNICSLYVASLFAAMIKADGLHMDSIYSNGENRESRESDMLIASLLAEDAAASTAVISLLTLHGSAASGGGSDPMGCSRPLIIDEFLPDILREEALTSMITASCSNPNGDLYFQPPPSFTMRWREAHRFVTAKETSGSLGVGGLSPEHNNSVHSRRPKMKGNIMNNKDDNAAVEEDTLSLLHTISWKHHQDIHLFRRGSRHTNAGHGATKWNRQSSHADAEVDFSNAPAYTFKFLDNAACDGDDDLRGASAVLWSLRVVGKVVTGQLKRLKGRLGGGVIDRQLHQAVWMGLCSTVVLVNNYRRSAAEWDIVPPTRNRKLLAGSNGCSYSTATVKEEQILLDIIHHLRGGELSTERPLLDLSNDAFQLLLFGDDCGELYDKSLADVLFGPDSIGTVEGISMEEALQFRAWSGAAQAIVVHDVRPTIEGDSVSKISLATIILRSFVNPSVASLAEFGNVTFNSIGNGRGGSRGNTSVPLEDGDISVIGITTQLMYLRKYCSPSVHSSVEIGLFSQALTLVVECLVTLSRRNDAMSVLAALNSNTTAVDFASSTSSECQSYLLPLSTILCNFPDSTLEKLVEGAALGSSGIFSASWKVVLSAIAQGTEETMLHIFGNSISHRARDEGSRVSTIGASVPQLPRHRHAKYLPPAYASLSIFSTVVSSLTSDFLGEAAQIKNTLLSSVYSFSSRFGSQTSMSVSKACAAALQESQRVLSSFIYLANSDALSAACVPYGNLKDLMKMAASPIPSTSVLHGRNVQQSKQEIVIEKWIELSKQRRERAKVVAHILKSVLLSSVLSMRLVDLSEVDIGREFDEDVSHLLKSTTALFRALVCQWGPRSKAPVRKGTTVSVGDDGTMDNSVDGAAVNNYSWRNREMLSNHSSEKTTNDRIFSTTLDRKRKNQRHIHNERIRAECRPQAATNVTLRTHKHELSPHPYISIVASEDMPPEFPYVQCVDIIELLVEASTSITSQAIQETVRKEVIYLLSAVVSSSFLDVRYFSTVCLAQLYQMTRVHFRTYGLQSSEKGYRDVILNPSLLGELKDAYVQRLELDAMLKVELSSNAAQRDGDRIDISSGKKKWKQVGGCQRNVICDRTSSTPPSFNTISVVKRLTLEALSETFLEKARFNYASSTNDMHSVPKEGVANATAYAAQLLYPKDFPEWCQRISEEVRRASHQNGNAVKASNISMGSSGVMYRCNDPEGQGNESQPFRVSSQLVEFSSVNSTASAMSLAVIQQSPADICVRHHVEMESKLIYGTFIKNERHHENRKPKGMKKSTKSSDPTKTASSYVSLQRKREEEALRKFWSGVTIGGIGGGPSFVMTM